MSTPLPSEPSTTHDGALSLPPLATPATLEALLSLTPATAPKPAASSATDGLVQPSYAQAQLSASHADTPPLPDALPAGLPPELETQAPLLFIHAGTQESALAHAWLQRMLGNTRMHLTRFQDKPLEQAMQLMPSLVLVDFESTSIEAASQLVAQLRSSLPQLLMVAVGHTRYPQCMLAALRASVQDFLDIDGSLLAAQQTVRSLLQRNASAQTAGPTAPLTALVSARAGLGSSLLAAHLAWYLQQQLHPPAPDKAAEAADKSRTRLEALLVDLGQPGGDCALYLNTPSEFDFLEAAGNLHRMDRRMASSGLAQHGSGLRLLPLPRQPGAAHEAASAASTALLQRLRQYFRHVLVDLGGMSQTPLAMDALRQASHIWVLCEQSVASVVATTELLQQMDALSIERERLRLIVCRHDGQLDMEASLIAQQLKLPLLETVPERRRELSQALNQGRLLSAQLRRDPYVQAVTRLTHTLLHSDHPELAAPPASAVTAPQTARWLNPLIQRFKRN